MEQLESPDAIRIQLVGRPPRSYTRGDVNRTTWPGPARGARYRDSSVKTRAAEGGLASA